VRKGGREGAREGTDGSGEREGAERCGERGERPGTQRGRPARALGGRSLYKILREANGHRNARGSIAAALSKGMNLPSEGADAFDVEVPQLQVFVTPLLSLPAFLALHFAHFSIVIVRRIFLSAGRGEGARAEAAPAAEQRGVPLRYRGVLQCYLRAPGACARPRPAAFQRSFRMIVLT